MHKDDVQEPDIILQADLTAPRAPWVFEIEQKPAKVEVLKNRHARRKQAALDRRAARRAQKADDRTAFFSRVYGRNFDEEEVGNA